MYSQSLFSASPVNDDVTVLENILSQGHGSNNFNYNWNNDLYPEQNQNYQTYQWVQRSHATSLNLNIQQSSQEPNQVYHNMTGGVPTLSSSFQQANCGHISQTYSSNQSFQGQSHQPILQSNLVPQGNFITTQQKLHHHQFNYIYKKTCLKSIRKRKRKRTMFTTEQVEVLEKVFQTKPYIDRDDRQALVEELQINDKVIKVWFQNRRLKAKREAEEAAQELYSTDAEAIETQHQCDDLSYVESQINRTDKFGYVTLDNRAVNGLVNVIDNLLSQTDLDLREENNFPNVSGEFKEETNLSKEFKEESKRCDSVIYEPISPASSECTNSDESTTYVPFEPKETLQRIFDIQEFLVFHKKDCTQR